MSTALKWRVRGCHACRCCWRRGKYGLMIKVDWVSKNFSVELVSALQELGIGLARLGLEKEPAK